MIRETLFLAFVLLALIGTGVALGLTIGDGPQSPDSDLGDGAELNDGPPTVPEPAATETPTASETPERNTLASCGTFLREGENGTEYKVTPDPEECE